MVLGLVMAVYLVVAMAFASKPDEHEVCTGVRVEIAGNTKEAFLKAADVKQILTTSGLNPVGKSMSQLDVRKIEELLRSKDLIETAECYRIQNGMLMVKVTQRIPLVRVMNDQGEDYCMDGEGKPMPHGRYLCNLIVATGHISRACAEKKVVPMVKAIVQDDFWKNQIVQINMLGDGTVELVPRVGNHVVYLGQPTGVQTKLERLRKFYLYGLNQAGWNKYSHINLEFDNQIICK